MSEALEKWVEFYIIVTIILSLLIENRAVDPFLLSNIHFQVSLCHKQSSLSLFPFKNPFLKNSQTVLGHQEMNFFYPFSIYLG